MKTFMTLTATLLIAGQATADVSAQVRAEASSSAAARVESRGAATRGDANAVVRATAEAGLPEAPVSRTVAEGRAKGASEAAITQAAVRTQGRLLVARDALAADGEREPSHSEITLGAEAMIQGATRADLERIGGSAPEGRGLETSLEALISLQARGEGAGQASSRIAAQLAAGASDLSVAALGGLGAAASVGASALQAGAGGASAASSISGSAAVGAGSAASAASGAVRIGASLAGSLGVGVVP